MDPLYNLLGLLGLRRGVILVLLAMIVAGREMTLKELAEQTGYAKSRVSEYLQTLEEMGLVRKTRAKKKVLYSVHLDELSRFLRERIAKIDTLISEVEKRYKLNLRGGQIGG